MFIFGRDPKLSLLEAVSYLKARSINYKFKELNDFVCVFFLQDLDFNQVIKDLGGTVKIGKVMGDLDQIELFDKIKYGISVYNGSDKLLKEQLKKRFKEERIRAVYKSSSGKENALSPSESIKLDLEFLVCDNIISKVIAVYNPKEYEKRDLNRPVQKPIHQISLRLAKIMINLSQIKNGEILLDPFCGIGTILQEALLMDIGVIGVDNNKGMVNAAERNLKWLRKGRWTVINEDSSRVKLDKKVNAIVTEPYLGPFLKEEVISESKASSVISGLEELYFGVLFNLSKYLIEKGKVVIIVPRFNTNKGKKTLNFDRIIDKLGFRVYNALEEVKVPMLYKPEGSKIERLMYVLERNSKI